MTKSSNKHTILINNTDGILVFPSESLFNPTSSAPSTAATVEIKVSPTLEADLISSTVLNPFIRIPFPKYWGNRF